MDALFFSILIEDAGEKAFLNGGLFWRRGM